MHSQHITNPDERNDFICGYRCCVAGSAGWTQRVTDRYGLLLCVQGQGQVSFDGSCFTVSPRQLLLLRPNIAHGFIPSEGWHFLWFHFQVRPHITYALEWVEQLPGMASVCLGEDEFASVLVALEEAHRLDLSRPRNWHDLALLLLESAVVRGYNRGMADCSGISTLIQQAQRLLTQTDESMDAIARHCGVSRAGLYAKFQAQVGVAPRQYREDARLRRAAQLLELPELSVAEIARQVGIPDAYYFSTRFHHFFGMSPSAFRKKLLRKRDKPAR